MAGINTTPSFFNKVFGQRSVPSNAQKPNSMGMPSMGKTPPMSRPPMSGGINTGPSNMPRMGIAAPRPMGGGGMDVGGLFGAYNRQNNPQRRY